MSSTKLRDWKPLQGFEETLPWKKSILRGAIFNTVEGFKWEGIDYALDPGRRLVLPISSS